VLKSLQFFMHKIEMLAKGNGGGIHASRSTLYTTVCCSVLQCVAVLLPYTKAKVDPIFKDNKDTILY